MSFPEPPSVIPAALKSQGLSGYRTWLEGLMVELVLQHKAGEEVWEIPAIKHWLHCCLDTQPEITIMASEIGWNMDTGYYYLELRHNFTFVPSRNSEFPQYTLRTIPRFASYSDKLSDSEFQAQFKKELIPDKLTGLLRHVYQSMDKTGYHPWQHLDFYLKHPVSPAYAMYARTDKSPSLSPQLSNKVDKDDFALAVLLQEKAVPNAPLESMPLDNLSGKFKVGVAPTWSGSILTASGTSIPASIGAYASRGLTEPAFYIPNSSSDYLFTGKT